jgi:hypothetical protein
VAVPASVTVQPYLRRGRISGTVEHSAALAWPQVGYTIVHPTFSANMDMRTIKPAGKLIYTAKGDWIVRKGGAFRPNPKQMHDHCEYILKSGEFKGSAFSFGDEYIEQNALKKNSCSTLGQWKAIGINHHIMHVLEDVAKLGGPP